MDDVVVALGGRRFRVDRGWYELPENVRLESVSAVAVDPDQNVWVYQRGTPPIVVFDSAGRFLRTWGDDLIRDGHGIYITKSRETLLVDRDGHSVLILSGDKLVRTIGDPERPQWQAPFNHPADVAVAPNGDIFVADGYGNSCIHRFSPDGVLVATWGRPGHGEGEFTTPHGIWVDHDSRVLVADRENDRIQVFSDEGALLDVWLDFYHPMDIYGDEDGNLYVTDQIPRLSMLSQGGQLIGRCKPVPLGAHGVWGDSAGNLYLAEGWPVDRVTRMTPIR